MVLVLFNKNNILLVVMINKIYSNEKEVFVGTLPLGLNDIPFTIKSDLDNDGNLK